MPQSRPVFPLTQPFFVVDQLAQLARKRELSPILTSFKRNSILFMSKSLSPFLFRLMLLRVLPLGFIAGLRLLRCDQHDCRIGIRYGYLTQNPFRSIYFAAMAMAAEMSTGLPALLYFRIQKRNVSMLVTDFQAQYYKKAVGRIVFRFAEVPAMQAAIDTAGPEGRVFEAVSRGYNAANECVAEMRVSWSFKQR